MSTTSNETISHPGRRRRWFQLSLRTSFVLVAVLCIWLARVSYVARTQRIAVQTVKELGGGLGYDYQLDGQGNWKENPTLWAPQWLSDRIGEDYFRRVAIVNFDEGSDPTNDDLAVVSSMHELQQLTLMNRKRISDEGLRHLAPLRKLEVLALNGTNVNGPGLVHLRFMQDLRGLSLEYTSVTDEALANLSHLRKLKWLFLSNTPISDKGLVHLSKLTSLENLQLRETLITDAGLKHLTGLTGLKQLLVGETKVTPEGEQRLKQALPNCKVSY